MSERDIPSRVMNEHVPDNRLPTTANHLMPPRIQSSKSVPSLNSKFLKIKSFVVVYMVFCSLLIIFEKANSYSPSHQERKREILSHVVIKAQ